MSQVVLKVPDFVDPEDGVAYTDIELTVESEGDVRDAARLTSVVENQLSKPPRRKQHE